MRDVLIAWGRAFQEGRYADALSSVQAALESLRGSGAKEDIACLERLESHCRSSLRGEPPEDAKSPCSFCGQRLAMDTLAVLGAEDSICVPCIFQAVDLAEGRPARIQDLAIVTDLGAVCSFCRVSQSKPQQLIRGQRASVSASL
jgi:hypothetical protein